MVATAQQKIETEERIFESALEVFSQKGKDGARMQEIADLAGINKAMLHYYFRSKEQLYEKVFDYVFVRYIQSVSDAFSEQDSFEATLRSFINAYIDNIEENPHVMRLMINENLSGGHYLKDFHMRNSHRKDGSAPGRLLSRLQEAVDAGEIRAIDPFHTLVSTISLCIFFFLTLPMQAMMDPRAKNRKKYIAKRKDHIFELVYRGLEPRS